MREPRTLFGRPIVEVDDMPVDEIRIGLALRVYPVDVTVMSALGEELRVRMEIAAEGDFK